MKMKLKMIFMLFVVMLVVFVCGKKEEIFVVEGNNEGS